MKHFLNTFFLVFSSVFFLYAQDVSMNNENNGQTISQCSGTLYDSGGATNSYQNGENLTLTICAENAGDAVQLAFTFFDIYNFYLT